MKAIKSININETRNNTENVAIMKACGKKES